MASGAVLGTGLIGASLGLGLQSLGWEIRGWDPDGSALKTAAEMGAVTAARSREEAVQGVDLVFLAGPLGANLAMLAEIDTKAVVTDVTSVKVPMVDARPPQTRFIGGHPMAGREHAGPAASSAALFRGAAWVLCDDGAESGDLEFVHRTVTSLGANPVIMSAAQHDQVVASISHLPHLVAVALTNLAGDSQGSSQLISGSFRDLTRVAAADVGWWPEVLAANATEVSTAVNGLIDRLRELEAAIVAGQTEDIGSSFELARHSRTQMAPALARVSVVLQDKPGEIASVGHALERSHVDVRDLQLRHAEHGGGGILTITVRPGEEQPLRQALDDEGFNTE